jgi:hypothetical protein
LFNLQQEIEVLTGIRYILKRLFYITLLLTFSFVNIYGQISEPDKFVQLSGLITDINFRPVQGVSVISRKLHRATVSEATGIYSITSTPGDTVLFRALGFKRYHTIIPSNYSEKHCLADIVLEIDTFKIDAVTILPWKNYTEFIKEMTKEKPVDPVIEYMNENIASIYVAINNQTGVRLSPEAGYRYAMEQNFSAMSTRNQYPVNNLLNPFAWAKFVSGVKHGIFKNQTFKKPEEAKVIKKKAKRSKK